MVAGRPNRLRAAVAPSDDCRGFHDRPLLVEPPFAALDLVGVGPLVQAALAAHLVLEVLDGVGHEGVVACDACFRQGPVENLSGGPHEGPSGEILLVAGLLAHQHQPRVSRTLAGHDLGCRLSIIRFRCGAGSVLL
jgi:hypothetical protein